MIKSTIIRQIQIKINEGNKQMVKKLEKFMENTNKEAEQEEKEEYNDD